MLAVYKREFKSFFQNVIGWIFIAAMVFIASLYFRVYNLSGGYSDIRYIFINLLMIMVFAIPVLVMRSLPEERKNKIDQLTLTSPVTIGKIVTGKYLAMVSVLGITTLVLGSFIFLIMGYTTVDWPINGLAMLGFFLYGAASIAVCLLITSFTESQVLAAIVCIIISFVIYMIAGIQYLLEATENSIMILVAKGLGIFNFTNRFDTFLNGVLDAKSIVYFISVIVVCIFLTTQVIQKRRFTASVKNISMQAFSISMIVIVLAVAIVGNLAFGALPTKYTEIDATSQKLYTLTDATKDLVAQVNEPLKIYVYVSDTNKDETIDRILQEYVELNKNISVEYKDPSVAPKFYEKYTSESPVENSLFMEMADKTRYINSNDMYIQDYSYNENTGSYDTTYSYDIEGQITSGISYMLYGNSVTIYNITGHDEASLEDGYKDAIKKANYAVEDLSLLGNDIPEDCQIVLINAPMSDYSSDDADKLIEFFDNGGTAIITLEIVDNVAEEMPNFSRILDYFGISVADGLVVDMKAYAQSPFFIIPDIYSDDITNGVYGRKNVWMPYAKSLITSDDDENVTISTILASSSDSYNKTDLENANSYDKEDGDEDGPFSVAVKAVKTDGGQALVIGSPYLFSDTVDQATANASSTMFMNMVNGSITEEETMAAVVPARSMDSETFIISSLAGFVIFLVLMIVVPFVLIIIGLVVWLRRRKK